MRAVHASNSDDQGIQPDGVGCAISAGGCTGRVVGRTVWKGDFKGIATYVLNFKARTDGSLSYEGVEHITGAVLDCGGGTFDLRITNGVYDPKKNLDAPGSPVTDQDDWRVATGSGTGDLAGLSGRGTEVITEYQDGKTASRLKGAVACHHRRRSSKLTLSGGLHAVTDAVPNTTVCDKQGGEYATSPTDYIYSGASKYYGTFEGTGRLCGHSLPFVGPGNTVPFVEVTVLTGTFHGCGTGSVTYTVHGFVEGRPDLKRRGLAAEEEWRLVAGSGTKGLRALRSGSGKDVGVINPDSSIDAPFVGRVTCAAASKRAS